MADLREWGKGITFFIFVTLMFYFFWDNIFSNLIEWASTDFFNIGATASASFAILKTAIWISFVLLYLSVGGGYLFFTIIIGPSGNVETNPIELLKAVGIWSILAPFLAFIYGLIHFFVDIMGTATTSTLGNTTVTGFGGSATTLSDPAMLTTASTFSWLLTLIIFIFLIGLPFIYVLKGYGVDLFKQSEQGVAEIGEQ